MGGIAAPLMTPPRWRIVALAAGAGCVGLGSTVVVGWLLDQPVLQSVRPGWSSMKVNTALAFLLSGMALLLAQWRATRRLAAAAAATVFTIAALTAVEYLSGIDLRIDQLLVTVPPPPGLIPDSGAALEAPPGRMALATALAFVAAGLGLLQMATGAKRPAIGYVGRACAYGVLGIGTLAVTGYAVDADFLYVWYAFGSLAVHTAVGLAALGLGMLAASNALPSPGVALRADARIAALAAGMLALAAGATAVVSFATLQWEIRHALADGLRLARDERVGRIETTLQLRLELGAVVATRTRLVDALRRLRVAPQDASARQAVEDVLRSFAPHGFTAIAVALPDGHLVASIGEFITLPAVRVPLDQPPGSELLWQDGFLLSQRVPMDDAGAPLGELHMQQSLPDLLPTVLHLERGWSTADFILCGHAPQLLRCFPSRAHAAPFTVPITPAAADRRQLSHLVLDDGPGFYSATDVHGTRVLAYAGPVASLGLIAILQVEAAEIYAPLGRQFLLAMLLAATLAGAGALLVARWLQPIAAEPERQVVERTADLRRANADTRRSEASFRALIDASAQVVWVTDADGVAIDDAVGWRQLTGQSVDEWAGWGWLDAIHPDHRATTEALWREAVATRRAFATEYRVRLRDGGWRWTSVRAAPVYEDDGTLRGWVGMNIDIDDRKSAEAALRRKHEELEARVAERTRELAERNAVLTTNQARLTAALREKELLVREVHHRVKNNLQVMTSLLNLQGRLTAAPAALAALDDARGRLASIGLLYDKLHLAPDLGQIALGEYLREVAQRGIDQLDGSTGRVRLHAASDPIPVTPDRAIPCGLIVNELVTNALKHAFVGREHGAIQLNVRRTDDGGVRLTVADDGIGLPADLDPEANSRLGLQLVAMFAEQIDATLVVHRDGGTSWDVTFRSDA